MAVRQAKPPADGQASSVRGAQRAAAKRPTLTGGKASPVFKAFPYRQPPSRPPQASVDVLSVASVRDY